MRRCCSFVCSCGLRSACICFDCVTLQPTVESPEASSCSGWYNRDRSTTVCLRRIHPSLFKAILQEGLKTW